MKTFLVDAARAALQGCVFGAFFVAGAATAGWAIARFDLARMLGGF